MAGVPYRLTLCTTCCTSLSSRGGSQREPFSARRAASNAELERPVLCSWPAMLVSVVFRAPLLMAPDSELVAADPDFLNDVSLSSQPSGRLGSDCTPHGPLLSNRYRRP